MTPIEIQSPFDIQSPTPIRVAVDREHLPQGDLQLQPEGETKPLAAQRDGEAIVVMIPQLCAHQVLRCDVIPTKQAVPGVTLKQEAGRLTMRLPEGEFGSYHFGPDVVRPFFWPLLGPGQIPVTREVKMNGEAEPDHGHHRSLFTAYEEANGSSNWNELEGHGFTRHQEFTSTQQGPVFAHFTAHGLWTNKDGKPVLTEARSIRLYNAGDTVRLFDYDVAFEATHGDVEFGDTKEAGILGIRVNPSMNGSVGGVITNSEGGRGEAECWGRKAAWCDYTGEVDGKTVGITVFDHPSNLNYPTRWHVRNYGLFATNPFSTASFEQGEPSPYVLKSNESITFRYRVLIHRGNVLQTRLQNIFQAFCTFPA